MKQDASAPVLRMYKEEEMRLFVWRQLIRHNTDRFFQKLDNNYSEIISRNRRNSLSKWLLQLKVWPSSSHRRAESA